MAQNATHRNNLGLYSILLKISKVKNCTLIAVILATIFKKLTTLALYQCNLRWFGTLATNRFRKGCSHIIYFIRYLKKSEEKRQDSQSLPFSIHNYQPILLRENRLINLYF